MNSKSAFTWEDAKQVADQALFNKMGVYLSDVEIEVLKGAWEGLTYEKMAEEMSQRRENKKFYSVDYLRGDVGYKLFRQKLSLVLGEEISKTNFKGALEREWHKRQQLSVFTPVTSTIKEELIFPEGSVPLNSPLYLERNRVESLCYEAIAKSASLIRIKAPKLMGKTSLVTRILAQGESLHYRLTYLDLSSVERGIINNLDKFLRWFCLMTTRQLNLKNRVDEYWDKEILGSNDNCTVYFEEYLLSEIESPLILALDDVDRIFPYPDVAEDCLGMLRSWHEKGKISSTWKQLRLVMAYSTECYIPLDMNQSPFNAGIPIELGEFDYQQVKQLAHLHELKWKNSQLQALIEMVGGHPYLLRLAFYQISSGQLTLEQLLQEASTEAGIYSNHLRRNLEALQTVPDLIQAFKKVVTSPEPVKLDSIHIYQLNSMGLIEQKYNQVMPRCHLYRDYFYRVL
jgi:hypothetical protein